MFELNLKLSNIQQGGNSVTQYFHTLKRIWQDLDLFDTYEWKSTDDQKHYWKTIEDGRIYKFFVNLNVEFDKRLEVGYLGKIILQILMMFFLKFAGKKVTRML